MSIKPENVDQYIESGCGRCKFGGTPQCKVKSWIEELGLLRAILLESGLTEEIKWNAPCYTHDGKNILMLGAGGAARAISFTLAQNTRLKELSILDIDEAQLRRLKNDLETGTDATIKSGLTSENTLAEEMEKTDVIIHCTPIGMHPNIDASLISPELFRPGQVVFDIVYTPFETKLLADARSRGLKVIPGVEMFINQAALQFEHFTGVDAPVEVMRGVVMENLKS